MGDTPERLRPIQPKALGDCRVLLLHAAADRPLIAPLAELLSRSGAHLEARSCTPDQAFKPAWLADVIQSIDRVVLAWSSRAAACPQLAQILDASGTRYRNRLYVMPVDASPLPERFMSVRRPALRGALTALGSGDAVAVPERLAHRRATLRRLRRRAWIGFAVAGALGVGALLVHRPPLLRFGFIGPAFLAFGAGTLLLAWAWMDLRYLGQRIALLLADRQLD